MSWPDGLILIDPRQSARNLLNTYIHELLHVAVPDLTETTVTRAADTLADALWVCGYRKIKG